MTVQLSVACVRIGIVQWWASTTWRSLQSLLRQLLSIKLWRLLGIWPRRSPSVAHGHSSHLRFYYSHIILNEHAGAQILSGVSPCRSFHYVLHGISVMVPHLQKAFWFASSPRFRIFGVVLIRRMGDLVQDRYYGCPACFWFWHVLSTWQRCLMFRRVVHLQLFMIMWKESPWHIVLYQFLSWSLKQGTSLPYRLFGGRCVGDFLNTTSLSSWARRGR